MIFMLEKSFGNMKNTTNSVMELMAMSSSLEQIKQKSNITFYSDSNYIINSFNKGWIYGWGNFDFLHYKLDDKEDSEEVTGEYNCEITKDSVKNKELWEHFFKLIYEKTNKICFKKVKAHQNDILNNLCDKLAKSEANKA